MRKELELQLVAVSEEREQELATYLYWFREAYREPARPRVRSSEFQAEAFTLTEEVDELFLINQNLH